MERLLCGPLSSTLCKCLNITTLCPEVRSRSQTQANVFANDLKHVLLSVPMSSNVSEHRQKVTRGGSPQADTGHRLRGMCAQMEIKRVQIVESQHARCKHSPMFADSEHASGFGGANSKCHLAGGWHDGTIATTTF